MSISDVAFVGRGRELAALAGWPAAGTQGTSGPDAGVVLVQGPAGVGKSMLVDHALRQAGIAAVRGYCPAEPAPPLWPWRAILRRVSLEITQESDVEPTAAASARFAALARMSDAVLAAGRW